MITAIEVPDDVKDPRLMAIVKANNGKRYLIFDPTNERVPVGNLPSYEQGSYGTLAAGADSQVLPLPILPPDANSNQRKGSFTLAPDGTLTGSVESVLTGSGGGEMRNLLKYSDEKDVYKRQPQLQPQRGTNRRDFRPLKFHPQNRRRSSPVLWIAPHPIPAPRPVPGPQSRRIQNDRRPQGPRR